MRNLALSPESHPIPRLAGALAVAIVCAAVLAPSAHAARGMINLPYSSPGALPGATIFNFYYPDSGITPNNPTVILLHGGGYIGGNRWEFQTLAPALADRGFNVLCPEYTLATSTRPSFPQAITDTLALISSVRRGTLGLNLSPIIILGGTSAGATIAATAAYGAENALFAANVPGAPGGLRPDAFVGMYGRYDILWNSVTPPAPWLPGSVYTYVGTPASGQTMSGLFAAASAVTYIDQCAPPSALYHGDADTVVPVQNTLRLDAALHAWGVPVWTTIVPGGGHDTTTMPYGTAGAAIIGEIIPTLLAASSPACPRSSPIPYGACCAANGVCTWTTEGVCQSTWSAQGLCIPNTCPLYGACCAAPGECTSTTQNDCTGTWTIFAACSPALCPTPNLTGACCFGASCIMANPDSCTGPNQRFIGADAACNPPGDLRTPCCRADFSQDGTNSIDDLFLYFNAWFSSSPSASMSSGIGAGPTIDDLFLYLNAYFPGC